MVGVSASGIIGPAFEPPFEKSGVCPALKDAEGRNFTANLGGTTDTPSLYGAEYIYFRRIFNYEMDIT